VTSGRDAWGSLIAADAPASIAAWNDAWSQALHFVGDPFATLAPANETDPGFVLGSVFCGTYRVLSGTRPNDPALLDDANEPVRQCRHCWEQLAHAQRDFAAVRFAHDVYLHVGDDARRLRSSQRAFDSWDRADAGWGMIAGQHSFALEEVGRYDEAEQLGSEALNADPLDLWARHALAHVFESQSRSDALFALLEDDQEVWAAQEGLAVHLWWHLALRLIAERRFDEVLAVHDTQLPAATTAFRLCDLASLLWRLEIAGVTVGDRWDELANRFAKRSEWHTVGFLDLHGALIFSRRPEHARASHFFDGAATQHAHGTSENDLIFSEIVGPLVKAIQLGTAQPALAVTLLDGIADRAHRIGGSIAQREIIALTRMHFQTQTHSHPDASEAT